MIYYRKTLLETLGRSFSTIGKRKCNIKEGSFLFLLLPLSALDQSQYHSPSLWRALAYSYGPAFALAAVLKVFTDLLAFAQPLFLHLLLAFISEYQRDKEHTSGIRGFAICGLMFISAIAQSAILHQVSFQFR